MKKSMYQFALLFSLFCFKIMFGQTHPTGLDCPNYQSNCTGSFQDDSPRLGIEFTDLKIWIETDAGANLSISQTQSGISQALDDWNNQTDFYVNYTFVENYSEADLQVWWCTNDQINNESLENNGSRTIGYSYYPKYSCHGIILLNKENYTWTLSDVQNGNGVADLVDMFMHEFGHFVGMCHYDDDDHVMYWGVTTGDRNRTFSEQEREDIGNQYKNFQIFYELVENLNPQTTQSRPIIDINGNTFNIENVLSNTLYEKTFLATKFGSYTITASENYTQNAIEYCFMDWRDENGNLLTTNRTYSLNNLVVNGRQLTANFAPPRNISIEYNYEFDGAENLGVVKEIYPGETKTINADAIIPNKNGRTYYFAGWSDGNGDNPRTVSTTDDVTFTALYKTIQKSNETTAYSNNGQRKLIETESGNQTWLHKIYSSMGHVWIEHSSNNGQTWVLGNNGQPLDGSAGGKNPSIAYTKGNIGYNYIGVVWQQKDGSYYKIMGKMFNQSSSSSSTPSSVSTIRTLHTEPADLYSSVNANPNLVLASGNFGAYFVTFERKSTSGGYLPGINWVVGKIEDIGHAYAGPFGYVEDNGLVNGTNA